MVTSQIKIIAENEPPERMESSVRACLNIMTNVQEVRRTFDYFINYYQHVCQNMPYESKQISEEKKQKKLKQNVYVLQ